MYLIKCLIINNNIIFLRNKATVHFEISVYPLVSYVKGETCFFRLLFRIELLFFCEDFIDFSASIL